jgi:hypothetical protein
LGKSREVFELSLSEALYCSQYPVLRLAHQNIIYC